MSIEVINHTADVGIRVHSPNLAKLFEEAARGMFELITSLKGVKKGEVVKIELKSNNLTDLLHDWLSELLYIYEVDGILFCNFHIEELSKNKIRAKAYGEILYEQEIKTEIKAVTYHHLKVQEENNGWVAEVIFDI
jgi:SHS2 domain-containing protein